MDAVKRPNPEAESIAYRYVGGGFVPGIPARDLTAAEAAAHDEDAIESSGLYEKVS